ncbi:ABC transporter permease [Limnohabitans sp. MMS-10A-178]|uniref:ABC transporter permease n=1 Tax=Limnohabitans sp. MMS-10A-178 TaxID=1835767 RepID=UPI000D3BBD56|nr:ABC transporter permease [Limnohabitans sp. MMS-10A-178]PUE16072.1 sugar ABC transporter permease [Limnohabitans sp. MMS-10A-178]
MKTSTTFREALRVQLRVIYALLMREVITRFGRENLGVLWLILEPALFTLGVTGLWTAAGLQHGSNLPIVSFAITGYSSVLIWRNTATKCNQAIIQNFNLLYHRNVHIIDVLITRIILEVAGATASFLILCLAFIAFEVIEPPVDLFVVLCGWLMMAWFGASLGLILGAASSYSELVDRIWHPTSYLLFPLSGAAFMVDWLPKLAQDLVMLLPMIHGVELIREGYFGHLVKTHYSIMYMSFVCLLMNLVGMILVRDASRRVEAP